tara:strand:+ start:942 stop:1091 length:150 start_codon:yes stop_codon:yes gene_type:complete
MSLRIATGGNVDAGKSTFTACLFGEKDMVLQGPPFLHINMKKNMAVHHL